MKLADFGLAIEVEGEQQAWFGNDPFIIPPNSIHIDFYLNRLLICCLLIVIKLGIG